MLISAVVIVGYTALGGFMAASFTDLIQSIVMTIALVLVVCFGVSMSGGVSTILWIRSVKLAAINPPSAV